MNRALNIAVAGLVASSAIVTTASAGSGVKASMTSVDTTQPGGPRIHDNGVPDGRTCVIYWRVAYDPWIEDYRRVKAKKCFYTY